MSVLIYEEKSKKTGRSSLILTRTINGIRIKRSLGLYFKTSPQTYEEKEQKKEKYLTARKIANDETKKLLNGEYRIEDEYRGNEDFIAYAENFIAQHAVKDKRKYFGVIKRLKKFFGKESIPAYEMNEVAMQRFAKSLENELHGESPHGYFQKLRQIINAAVEENLFKSNPARKVRIKLKVYIVKEILSMEEVQKLYNTPLSNEQVKRAFLFACLTGLRWVDCKALRWKHIRDNSITLIQAKTGTLVTIPLNSNAVELIGEKGNAENTVFMLPSHTGALKAIRKWTGDAGISKKITFHCARHSFGTALVANGNDLSTTSRLLGHANVSQSMRYVKTSEILKRTAIDTLPVLFKQIS